MSTEAQRLAALIEAHAQAPMHYAAATELRRLSAESAARLQKIEQHCYEKDRLKAECNRLASALKQLVIATKHLHPCPGTLDIAERLIGEQS